MRTAASTSGPSTARSSRRSSRGASSSTALLPRANRRRRRPARAASRPAVLAAACARRDEQLEEAAGAEQIEVFGVEVCRIAEALAALAAALPAVFEPRQAALVERHRARARDRARSARGRERTAAGRRRGSASPATARSSRPSDHDERDAGERTAPSRAHARRRVRALEPSPRRRAARPSRDSVGRVYGRTLPSVFHRYSVRVAVGRVGEGVDLVGLPVAHAEVVRHDARAGLELAWSGSAAA